MFRNTQESENARHYSTPSYAVPNAPLQSGQRYNAPAYQQALDVAVRLRAEHPGVIPVQEVEDAALEAGIEPRLIHEALTALQPQTTYPTYQAPPVVTNTVYTQETLPTRQEACKEMGLMFGIPVVFGFLFTLLTSFLMVAFGHRLIGNSLTATGVWLLIATLVPVALSLFLGMNLRKKRQGAIAGMLVGIGAGIAGGVSAGIQDIFVAGPVLGILGAVVGGGLGAIGTALGQSLYGPSDKR